MTPDRGGTNRQSLRFLLLYGSAWAGSTIAYVPFLTLLLPIRVEAIGADTEVQVLAFLTFAGALAASAANVLFGWISDRSGNRRGWIAGGLAANVCLLLSFSHIHHPRDLLALLLLWQISLNMMLAPLAALAGDYVPDRQKGLLGGLLAIAPVAGSLSGVLITLPGLAGADGRLALVAVLVVAAVSPILLVGKPVPMPQLAASARPEDAAVSQEAMSRPSGVIRMWVARLVVQIAEATLFAFLLYYLRTVDPSLGEETSARLYGFVTTGAIPITLFVGRWADARNRPILPLTFAASSCALSLGVMSIAGSAAIALIGYGLFGLSITVFLSLHTSQTLRVLPSARHRGRDLGIFNLTNTIPSLIMPWLALLLVPNFGYASLFALLAALAALATLLLASIGKPAEPAPR